MESLPVAIVLPCLNEESTLLETCHSLGFARGASTDDLSARLIIVDNDSDDDTLAVAEVVRETSAPGSVYVIREHVRGYVPPRHRGTIQAGMVAAEEGWREVLILQADGDTTYTDQYVHHLRDAALAAGRGAFLEGTAEFPREFRTCHPDYYAGAAETDTRVLSELGIPSGGDLIATDSVCAYRLNDYIAWGGHLREYAEGKDELHAETTRLYMRSLACGSRKIAVPNALAYPSARKAVRRPGEEFATAGFPREISWRQTWRDRRAGAEDVPLAKLSPAELAHTIRVRERHLAALFGVLPLHVFRALGRDIAPDCDVRLRAAADELPQRGADDLFSSPGRFIEDVLILADSTEFWTSEP